MMRHHRGPHDVASTRSQQRVDSGIARDLCAGNRKPGPVACICYQWPRVTHPYNHSHCCGGSCNSRGHDDDGSYLFADDSPFCDGHICPGYRHRFSHGYQQTGDIHPGYRHLLSHSHQRAGDGHAYSDSDRANVHSDSNHVADGDTHSPGDSNSHAVSDGITNVAAHRAYALPAAPAVWLANLHRSAGRYAL